MKTFISFAVRETYGARNMFQPNHHDLILLTNLSGKVNKMYFLEMLELHLVVNHTHTSK